MGEDLFRGPHALFLSAPGQHGLKVCHLVAHEAGLSGGCFLRCRLNYILRLSAVIVILVGGMIWTPWHGPVSPKSSAHSTVAFI